MDGANIMKYQKTCPECNKTFLTSYKRQIICNDPICKKLKHCRESTEWRKANNDKWNAYQRQYRAEKAVAAK